MITLIFNYKDELEKSPIVLNLLEDTWSFSVRLDSIENSMSNYLEIFNLEKTLNDIPEIVTLFNLLRDTPIEDIKNIIIRSGEVELFNSNNFGQTLFRGVFLQFLKLGNNDPEENDMHAHDGVNFIIRFSNYSYPLVNNDYSLIPEEGE